MQEISEKIFGCLRDVNDFAQDNGLRELQAAVNWAEEVAMIEVLGIDLTSPIEIEGWESTSK